MNSHRLADNEARPAIRILAGLLALFCWAATGLIGLTSWSESAINHDIVVWVVFAIISTLISFKGFLPPWLLWLIPYANGAVRNENLRHK